MKFFKNIIKVIFTNNHILNKESIKNEKNINIIYQKKDKEITIVNDRLYLTDYSCIQIFDNDEIKIFIKFIMKIII